MKHKKSILCIIMATAAVFLFVATAIFLVITVPRFFFEMRLFGIPSEISNTPAVCVNGTLYAKSKQYDVATLCRRQDYQFHEILCVLEGKAYVICSQSNDWIAMSYDLDSGELCKLFTYHDPGIYYKLKPSDKTENKNGFYYKDHIVLSNGITVMSYCITDQSIETSIYSDFSFPESTITGKTVSKERVEISIDGRIKQFSFSQMAERSDSICKIYALKNEKHWDGPSRIPCFFNDTSIQVVDNCAYALGSCLHYLGESYAIVLQYDPSEEAWQYVGYYFFGDIVDEECYIVFAVGTD